MDEVTGWLLDVYADEDGLILWLPTGADDTPRGWRISPC